MFDNDIWEIDTDNNIINLIGFPSTYILLNKVAATKFIKEHYVGSYKNKPFMFNTINECKIEILISATKDMKF